ncbi:MAG: hypothetical protein M1815_001114 [Lichina confinis]|nr:MAG: hypothetical protein M1815_001114 [Lichina confinis]
MSTATDLRPFVEDDRARLAQRQHRKLLRALADGPFVPSSNGFPDVPPSGLSSGRSTPIPADAPPSTHSISSARRQVRAQQRQRLFPTIEYAARVSHFDIDSEHRDFRGFFVLFWIGLAIMVMTTMLRNIKDTGYPMRVRIWSLFTEKTWQLGLSDLAMVVSTGVTLPMHMLFRRSKGWLRWDRLGMPIQSLYQFGWLAFWICWPFIFNWAWTAQAFFTLHTLAILMKMHSYAFYNGHLSNTERHLLELDNPFSASSPPPAYKYPSTGSSVRAKGKERLREKGEDEDSPITSLREDLALELTSPLGQVTYPSNLTAWNFVDYLACPTLCYELEYPRTEEFRWFEVAIKSLAVFGCIFLLTIISEEYVLPVLTESALRLEDTTTPSEAFLILVESISLLLFPFTVIMLLVFFVIFEYVLGAFAEITCFADRCFYSDWWKLEFSREWNIPVHNFFRRHVYGASRAHLSRPTATIITFFISAIAHELVMGCITKKFRGYGFIAMMLQLPIVMVQRTKWVRGKKLFNNICFWCSMIFGLSMVSETRSAKS